MATPVQLVIEGRDESKGAFASATGSITKIGQIAAGILTSQVFTALANGVVNFGKATLSAAIESQNALADLNATIASTGGVAGVTAEFATALAGSLQTVTRFGDETIISAQSMLLTFTKIGKDIFPQATEAALNMAEKFKTDPTQAAIQLGKALNEPIEGVAALRRVGVQLTDEQEEQIKKFMELGDIASAQKVILGELETEFGGLARAMGQTFAGRMDILKNRLGEVQEKIGLALIPILERLMDKFEPFIPVIEDFADTLSKAFAGEGLEEVKKFISDGLDPIRRWWDENGAGITAAVQQVFGGLQTTFNEIMATAGPFVAETFGKIKDWFFENGPLIQAYIQQMADVFTTYLLPAVVVVWETLSPILGGIIDLILGLAKTVMQVATGDWAGAWATIQQTAINVWNAILLATENLLQGLLGIFGWSVETLAADVSTGFEFIKTSIVTKIGNMITAVKTKVAGFVQIGAAIVAALKNGITSAWSGFVDWVIGMVQSIIEGILGAVGVGSGSSNSNTGNSNSGTGAGTNVINNNTTSNSPFINYGTVNNGSGFGRGNLVDQFG